MTMTNRYKSFSIAAISTALFLLITVFSSSSAFNLLPYMIYEGFFGDSIGEANFIIAFDIIFGIFLFFMIYRVSNLMLAKNRIK